MAKPPGNLSETQLATLRAALDSKRTELVNGIALNERRRPDDEERPIEDGDLAEREIEETDSSTLAEHDRTLLAEVDAALARMAAGSYGVSEASGEPIPFARLQALPWARTNKDD